MNSKEFENVLVPLAGEVENYLKRFCHDVHTVQDIVQEVYLKLWRNRHKLPELLEPKAYLFRAARNTLIDAGFFKLQKIRYDETMVSSNRKEQTVDFSKENDLKEFVELVHMLLDRLPIGQQEIVYLRDMKGLSTREVSEIVNESEVYVRVNLSRGRKQLRDILVNEYKMESYDV